MVVTLAHACSSHQQAFTVTDCPLTGNNRVLVFRVGPPPQGTILDVVATAGRGNVVTMTLVRSSR